MRVCVHVSVCAHIMYIHEHFIHDMDADMDFIYDMDTDTDNISV